MAESYGECKKVLGSVQGSNEHRVLDLMKQSPCLRLRLSIPFLSAFVLSNSFEAWQKSFIKVLKCSVTLHESCLAKRLDLLSATLNVGLSDFSGSTSSASFLSSRVSPQSSSSEPLSSSVVIVSPPVSHSPSLVFSSISLALTMHCSSSRCRFDEYLLILGCTLCKQSF